MRIRNHSAILLVGFGVLAMTVSGPVSSKANLLDKEKVSVERVPSKKKAYVTSSYAFQEGEELVVSGKVRLRRNVALSSQGHIDIAIFSPEGKVIKKASVFYIPRSYLRNGFRPTKSSFVARFPLIPPRGSVVRVAYHSTLLLPRKSFNCGHNIAAHP